MSGAARGWVWVLAVVAALMAVGLPLVWVLVDLNTAGQVASLVGAVGGFVGLVISVLSLRGTGPGSGVGRRVRAGQRGIAVGGDITGSALGSYSKVTGPRTAPTRRAGRRGTDDVRAGRDGIATGGDITDSALGEGSER